MDATPTSTAALDVGPQPAQSSRPAAFPWGRFLVWSLVTAAWIVAEHRWFLANVVGLATVFFPTPFLLLWAVYWTVRSAWRRSHATGTHLAIVWSRAGLWLAVVAGAVHGMELPSPADLAQQFERSKSGFETLRSMAIEDDLGRVVADNVARTQPSSVSPERFAQYRSLMATTKTLQIVGPAEEDGAVNFFMAGWGWLRTRSAGIEWLPEGRELPTPQDDYEQCRSTLPIEGRWYSYLRFPCTAGDLQRRRSRQSGP